MSSYFSLACLAQIESAYVSFFFFFFFLFFLIIFFLFFFNKFFFFLKIFYFLKKNKKLILKYNEILSLLNKFINNRILKLFIVLKTNLFIYYEDNIYAKMNFK